MSAPHDKSKWITLIILLYQIFKTEERLRIIAKAVQVVKKAFVIMTEQVLKIV
jgi:hypothetical protein